MKDRVSPSSGSEAPKPPEGDGSRVPESVSVQQGAVRAGVEQSLSLQNGDRDHELQRRREAKELSLFAFDPMRLWWLNGGDDKLAEPTPLTRSMLTHSTGEQAVVLSEQERSIVRRLTFIDRHGRKICLALEDVPEDEILIIFPEELGDAS